MIVVDKRKLTPPPLLCIMCIHRCKRTRPVFQLFIDDCLPSSSLEPSITPLRSDLPSQCSLDSVFGLAIALHQLQVQVTSRDIPGPLYPLHCMHPLYSRFYFLQCSLLQELQVSSRSLCCRSGFPSFLLRLRLLSFRPGTAALRPLGRGRKCRLGMWARLCSCIRRACYACRRVWGVALDSVFFLWVRVRVRVGSGSFFLPSALPLMVGLKVTPVGLL